MGLDGPGTSEDELWEVGGREALREHLHELVDAKLEEKEQEVGEADWTMVERLVLLRTIDSLWVEHLTELDDMRRGIGLRGYAQQDPLNEFRREAFALYTELRELIRHQLATTIFRVTMTRQPAPPPAPLPMPDASTLAALGEGSGDGSNGDGRAGRRTGARTPAGGGGCGGAVERGRAGPADRPERPGRPRVARRRGRRQGSRAERCSRRAPPRVHADRPADRAQRHVLLRLRAEVQEVSRPVTEGSPDRRAR